MIAEESSKSGGEVGEAGMREARQFIEIAIFGIVVENTRNLVGSMGSFFVAILV